MEEAVVVEDMVVDSEVDMEEEAGVREVSVVVTEAEVEADTEEEAEEVTEVEVEEKEV